MDTHDEFLPAETYTTHLANFPEACLELVLEHDGEVLLARRRNAPARGEWFWPGSRLLKGETFPEAVDRVAADELGIEVGIERQLGAYAHFWEETPFEGVESRHTVNVVYLVTPDPPESVSAIELDDQHDAYRFIDRIEPGLHPYVRTYLEDNDLMESGGSDG